MFNMDLALLLHIYCEFQNENNQNIPFCLSVYFKWNSESVVWNCLKISEIFFFFSPLHSTQLQCSKQMQFAWSCSAS